MFSSFIKIFGAVLLIVLLAGCNITIDLGTDSPPADTSAPPPRPTSVPPAAPEPTPLPEGWAVYRNEVEGFEIAYPTTYAPLDDATNLYGWTNGLLLLYNAGQSYDIVVQVWSSHAEYESALGSDLSRVTIFPSGDRFFTVMDITQEPENPAVIATFRLIS